MRISKGYLIFLVCLTLVLDITFIVLTLTGAGLVIEFVLTAITWFLIIFLFQIKGVNLISLKQVKKIKGIKAKGANSRGKVISVIGELIPGVDIFIPGYTLFVYYVYKETVEEDKAKLQIKEQQEQESSTRIPRKGSVEGSTGDRLAQRGAPNNVVPFPQKNEVRDLASKRVSKRDTVKYGT